MKKQHLLTVFAPVRKITRVFGEKMDVLFECHTNTCGQAQVSHMTLMFNTLYKSYFLSSSGNTDASKRLGLEAEGNNGKVSLKATGVKLNYFTLLKKNPVFHKDFLSSHDSCNFANSSN